MLGGEDDDLRSGSFPCPPAADLATPPLLSRKATGAAPARPSFPPFLSCSEAGARAAAAAGELQAASLCGGGASVGASALAAAEENDDSLARLRCSLSCRCCCFSSIGRKRRLVAPPPPAPLLLLLPPAASAGLAPTAGFSSCWSMLFPCLNGSAPAERGPARFSVVLLSGAGCAGCPCCFFRCLSSNPMIAAASWALSSPARRVGVLSLLPLKNLRATAA